MFRGSRFAPKQAARPQNLDEAGLFAHCLLKGAPGPLIASIHIEQKAALTVMLLNIVPAFVHGAGVAGVLPIAVNFGIGVPHVILAIMTANDLK